MLGVMKEPSVRPDGGGMDVCSGETPDGDWLGKNWYERIIVADDGSDIWPVGVGGRPEKPRMPEKANSCCW